MDRHEPEIFEEDYLREVLEAADLSGLELLDLWCQSLGWTQARIAREMDVSRQAVHRRQKKTSQKLQKARAWLTVLRRRAMISVRDSRGRTH